MRRERHVRRATAAVAAVLVTMLALPTLVAAIEIASEGPLTRIIVSADLNCQVAHEDDTSLEFFGGETGSCGTFVAVGGTLYGPAAVPSAGLLLQAWTPISQAAVTGTGSGGDPFELVTVVDAGDSGLRIQQTDSYQIGEESYQTDIQITNAGGAAQTAIVYRAGDCFLQDSDTGFGRVDEGAPACVISSASDARIEQWVPLTPGSRYFEGGFSDVWARVNAQQSFPNECLCDQSVDNGAGLSWEVTVPAGGSVEVSHLTFFSPLGRQSDTTLRDSVPGPLDISLDPVVIASTAAITAGVVVFVPFPAALFNSTLEANYAEVISGVTRFRRWIGRLLMGIFGRARRGVASARSRGAPGATRGPETAGAADAAAFEASAVTQSPAVAEAPARRGFTMDEAFWRSPLGILAFVLASALLYSLLDPTIGFSTSSVATFLGLALGMVVMLLAFAIPMFIGARGQHVGVSARALPGTLLVALGCVVISRLADFQPGYLYGLIVGFTFSRELAKAESGKLEAAAAASALAVAVAAWILLPMVRGSSTGDQQFTAAILETAFATVVVAGLEAAAIAMLPLRFLPGERVRSWNQRAWIILLALATAGFCHILLNPSSGYLADSTRTSLFTVVLLLAAFGGGSVLFWAYFRFRPKRGRDATPPPPEPPVEPSAPPPPAPAGSGGVG